jgi:acyl-coenzyme A thioesterase PaaI-like protein
MTQSILNRELLPDNTCFGCGLENPRGLGIEIYRDPPSAPCLQARFIPTEHMTGFPGITHGGAIYTALDCLSTWVATLLGPNRSAAWLLRSAHTTYHRPAVTGSPLMLTGRIRQQGGPWEPVLVSTEARRADGVLCVETEFKVVPLSREKFLELAGIEQLPSNWRAFLQ